MKNDANYQGEIWSERQFNQKLQSICHNVSWMIFADVNKGNDTEKLIDLTCLETSDAQAITK